jgi:L-asparaginase
MPKNIEDSATTTYPDPDRSARANVFILYTGGTIGMMPTDPDNPASPLKPMKRDDFEKYVPELGKKFGIHWDIAGLKDEEPLDSSDVDSTHWRKMANAIAEVYDNWDGFVILHGTDTMAYTTSGLSFIMKNLAKPVVVTGSQLPISDERTDARLNLANAIYIAGYKATGLPLVPEVALCFGDLLLRGNRARKMSSSDLNAFDSPNFPALGHLGEHIEINTSLLRDPADNLKAPFSVEEALDTNVMDIGLFPGLKPSRLKALLLDKDSDDEEKLRGVVMRSFGAGNATQKPEFLDVIDQAINQQDKVILNVTQCWTGMVEMGLYEASSGLLERGVISGLDMTPEAALAKMFWILGYEDDLEEIKLQLQINQRGEQSQDLFDLSYDAKGAKDRPEDVAKASAQPQGQFRVESLERAVLRISGLGLSEAQPGSEFEVRVFVNLPNANRDTPSSDPHCAATFKEPYVAGRTLMRFVTPTIRQFHENGRKIHISVVPIVGGQVWYQRMSLSLFTKP